MSPPTIVPGTRVLDPEGHAATVVKGAAEPGCVRALMDWQRPSSDPKQLRVSEARVIGFER